MQTIVQNLATEYADEGVGPVVLMLHGWKDSGRTFDALVPELAKTRRVVRLDMPGFGGSAMPKEAWDISRYVEFVHAFVQKLGLEVDMLVGHSFGGRVIIKGVGSGALKAHRVVLISAAGLAKRRTWRNIVLSAFGKIGKFITALPPFSLWRTALRRKLYAYIGSDYFAAGELKDTFVRVVGEDLASCAEKIAVPTLLIWGTKDIATPIEQGKRAHELIPNSQFEAVENAGHFVHHERPGDVARLIKNFL